MSYRQLADRQGHRWDVEEEGPLVDTEGPANGVSHQLRFTRDDGEERVRTAARGLDRLADAELHAILEGGDAE